MKPMNNNEFKDKLSKTIANTLNALPLKKCKATLGLKVMDISAIKYLRVKKVYHFSMSFFSVVIITYIIPYITNI